LLASLVSVTLAPGIRALKSSRTVPEMVAVVCAFTAGMISSKTALQMMARHSHFCVPGSDARVRIEWIIDFDKVCLQI
jgi:hypothetical protein